MTGLARVRKSFDDFGSRISEDGLIRFDSRVFLLSFSILLLFIFCVSFRLHYSSVSYWDTIYPSGRGDKSGLLLGSPKSIRSDEWLVTTTFILSQFNKDYPQQNVSIGANKDPLVTMYNLPARHFSAAFKPQNWGYFGLGLERGFSIAWNFKLFGFFLSSFFLLMLIAGNRFWLSLFGAIWLLFSGFTQWWFSTIMVEMMTCLFIAFISLAYILLSQRRSFIIAGALMMPFFMVDAVLFFYPPFLITLVWMLAFMLVGFVLTNGRWQLLKRNFKARLPIITGVLFFVVTILFLFYRDTRGTIAAITNTSYPGSRIIQGGDTSLAKMFSGFTEAPRNEFDYPAIWANASETSNYFLFFPVIAMAWLRNYVMKIRNRTIITALLLFLFMISIWLLVKLPVPLARLSLMSYVPTNRAILALGIASVILTLVFLGEKARDENDVSKDRRFINSCTALVFFLLVGFGLYLNQATDEFLRQRHILAMAAFFSLASWLLLKRKRAAFSVLILVALTPYYMVNPVTAGLDPLTGNHIFQRAVTLNSQNPEAKWVVYGKSYLASLLEASGANVVNGVKYTPDLSFYSQLDPDGSDFETYNRYSHSFFKEPGDSQEGIRFDLTYVDSFTVEIDPCSQELEQLGINNFAFSYKVDQGSYSCLQLTDAFEADNVWFYSRAAGEATWTGAASG